MIQERISSYRDNLSKELDEIEPIALITSEERQYVMDLNRSILDELLTVNDRTSYKRVLKSRISSLNISGLDTEFREYILSSLERIAVTAEVNISFVLNQKLYGSVLATIIYLTRRK